jgi:hypothetical protein
VIILNERHLKRLMAEYVRYYHEDRTHLGLAKDMPAGRPVFARDRKALKRLKAPVVGRDEAVRKLKAYWSRLGFWPLGETGIHLLGMAQRGSDGSHKKCETLAGAASDLAGRRVC